MLMRYKLDANKHFLASIGTERHGEAPERRRFWAHLLVQVSFGLHWMLPGLFEHLALIGSRSVLH